MRASATPCCAGLVNAGALEGRRGRCRPPLSPAPTRITRRPQLNDDQRDAAASLAIGHRKGFDPVLLDGVTGSGKTEVYFEAIAECLRQGKQALVLLPEIALTEPFLKRFEARFGCQPVAWHSDLRSSQRRRAWRGIAQRRGRSHRWRPFGAVPPLSQARPHRRRRGARAELQAGGWRPIPCPRYGGDARKVRGHSGDPLDRRRPRSRAGTWSSSAAIAKSACPSGSPVLRCPTSGPIDLTQDPPPRGRWLAPQLVAGTRSQSRARRQSLLFLNRRGFAPLTLCRHCGHRFQCPNCTAWMVEHRLMHRLACHHCGHVMPPPKGLSRMRRGGQPGRLRTGRRADRRRSRRAVSRRRGPQSSPRTRSGRRLRAAEFVGAMEAGAIDIVVGTQLVTKGYHFPNLTLGRGRRCRPRACRR